MGYTGQHYTKAALVDGDGIDTGFYDPTTINWIRELLDVEAERLVTGIFGASAWPSQFYYVTSPEYPLTGPDNDAAMTPALIWRFVRRDWSDVMNPNIDYITKEYTGLGGDTKTFTTRWPKLTDVVVELIVQLRDEYPPFDVEQRLENILAVRETEVCAETVRIQIDDPIRPMWSPSQSGVTVSRVQIEYRYLPMVWYDEADITFGAIIEEITGLTYDQKIKDDLDIDDPIDGPFVVTG